MKNIKKKVSLYWDNQPCNIKNSKKKYMSKEFFNEIEKRKYYVEPHIKKFANFKYYKNKTVLEVGCGIGTDAKNFAKYAKQYIGIDYSKKSIEITKKRFEIFKIKKKYNLIHGDAENLSKIKFLKKKRFDLIYSWGVLHHTPNMQKCFDEIYKVANSKTEIKIMLYAKNSYKNFLLNHTNYRYEAQKNCPVVYKVDLEMLKKMIKNKFQIISTAQDFIFSYKINDYKKGKYIKLNYFEKMPKKIFKVLEKNIGEHFLINLKKNKFK